MANCDLPTSYCTAGTQAALAVSGTTMQAEKSDSLDSTGDHSLTGTELPRIKGAIPGPRSRAWVDRLVQRECPAITARRSRRAMALGLADHDPPVWVQARGSNVLDADGNLFVDLTAGFGVASIGHAHPRLVAAARHQVGLLPHAMGDTFFDPQRVRLLESISALTGMERTILGSSGSDAVEAAIKTARIATGRDKILAFRGGYHGLSFGALAATSFLSQQIRAPFSGQLGHHVQHATFGGSLPPLAEFAAVLVEPLQGRGGMNVPPRGWLAHLASTAKDAGALLILDEVFTGFGRTGSWFAFQAEGVRPDIICLGKGMSAGFPISACVGTAAVMDAWGASTGQAIHTQTFLGNPLGSAMALATIDVLREQDLPARAARLGSWLREELMSIPGVVQVKGRGLMLGAVLNGHRPMRPAAAPRKGAGTNIALSASRYLLEHGFMVLPCGEDADILGITPPLTITKEQLSSALSTLADFLDSCT